MLWTGGGHGNLWATPVAGLPLAARQARTARYEGASHVVVAFEAAQADAVNEAMHHRLAPRDVHLAGWDGRLASLIEQWGPDEPTVVLDARAVWHRGALRALFERAAAAEAARGFADAEGRCIGVVGPTPAAALRAWREGIERRCPDADAERLEPGALAGWVDTLGDVRPVASALWDACRKPTDGYVARWINRPVSLRISRLLASSPVRPNWISVFNLALGLGASALALTGRTGAVLAGAALLQANSILDGVDGELARVRYESSVLGEWLDTISDDVSNQLFLAALAGGAFRATGLARWAWLGAATVVPMALTSATYYRWLARRGRGDLLAFDWFGDGEATSPVEAFFSRLFRRDFMVMALFVMALGGVAHWMLWVTAPAATATLASLWRKVWTHSTDSAGQPEAGP